MEFGTTWCPPCKASIPHLSEMQKKLGDKVAVTSVHVWESRGGDESQAAIIDKVKAAYSTAEQVDAPVAHRVAVDNAQQAMAANWMGAAGLNSIPQAFIVVVNDSTPTIAWIGHPLSEQFGEVVQKAVDGKLDIKGEAKKAAEENARKARFEQTMGAAQQAFSTKDFPAALAAIDAALKDETDASYRGQYLRTKFNILSQTDEPAALAMARSLLDGELKNSENELMMFADLISNGGALKNPDSKLAVALAERANTLTGNKNPRILHTLAGAYAVDKQTDKAIETEEAAMKAYKELLGEEKGGVMIRMCQTRIDEWKKTKK